MSWRRITSFAVLCIAVVQADPVLACREAPNPNRYIRDGRLSHQLIVIDARSGFAGKEIKEWRVSRNGRIRFWSYYAGAWKGRPKRGKLQRLQLVRIAGCLDEYGFHDLPERLGLPPGPNRRQITVTFGGERRHLIMSREQSLEAAGRGQSAHARFARIALSIFNEVNHR